jgi:hypothetical protein
MPNNHSTDVESLRAEIAAAAARMIAEDGADYGSAKRKAVKQILGDTKVAGQILPDNVQIEEEVRLYNELFFADSQPARLAHLRRLAIQVMVELAHFSPYLTGAVLNGTAGAHSDIHLQLFADSPKDVEIYLMNRNINFEVSETTHARGRDQMIETLSFMYQSEGVHLAVYEVNDLRRKTKANTKRPEYADLAAVRALTLKDEFE